MPTSDLYSYTCVISADGEVLVGSKNFNGSGQNPAEVRIYDLHRGGAPITASSTYVLERSFNSTDVFNAMFSSGSMPSGSNFGGGHFGDSVRLNSDGSVLAILSSTIPRAPQYAYQKMRVVLHVYKYNDTNSTWEVYGTQPIAGYGSVNSNWTASVSIDVEGHTESGNQCIDMNDDGTIIAVSLVNWPSVYWSGHKDGKVIVYEYNQGTWQQKGNDLVTPSWIDANNHVNATHNYRHLKFGSSVSLNGAGDRIAISHNPSHSDNALPVITFAYNANNDNWEEMTIGSGITLPRPPTGILMSAVQNAENAYAVVPNLQTFVGGNRESCTLSKSGNYLVVPCRYAWVYPNADAWTDPNHKNRGPWTSYAEYESTAQPNQSTIYDNNEFYNGGCVLLYKYDSNANNWVESYRIDGYVRSDETGWTTAITENANITIGTKTYTKIVAYYRSNAQIGPTGHVGDGISPGAGCGSIIVGGWDPDTDEYEEIQKIYPPGTPRNHVELGYFGIFFAKNGAMICSCTGRGGGGWGGHPDTTKENPDADDSKGVGVWSWDSSTGQYILINNSNLFNMNNRSDLYDGNYSTHISSDGETLLVGRRGNHYESSKSTAGEIGVYKLNK